MISIKFEQKIKPKKPKFWTFEVFLGFFKNLKNLGFFRSHFPALVKRPTLLAGLSSDKL